MDTGREKEGDQGEANRSSRSSDLKGERKEGRHDAAPFYPDVLFIGRVESPLSPTMNRPRLEKNRLSENPADEGIGAGTFDDITQLENGIRSSLSRETRSQR